MLRTCNFTPTSSSQMKVTSIAKSLPFYSGDLISSKSWYIILKQTSIAFFHVVVSHPIIRY
jgi:hypothetical protein